MADDIVHRTDDEWEGLFDEDSVTEARRDAEESFRDFTSDEIEHLRRKAKTDLFFLATLLGYDKLSIGFHKHFCNWLQQTRKAKYRLILLPRGHYKSTIKTITESVQMALPNVADVQEHPYSMGPNIKILIAHEVRETASDFLFEIAAAFTKCPAILALFPKCIPSKKNGQRINKWSLDLPRDVNPKESTFNTIGAGGASQGGHYNHMNFDDLIGKEARDSPTVMMRTLDWFDNTLSLTTDEIDGFDLVGTRWGSHDVYSHAMEQYGINENGSVISCIPETELNKYRGGFLKTYARGALEDGQAIFPELMSEERILILRKNALVWAAQYANNPRESGLNEFSWDLNTYNVDPHGNIVVFTGDSSRKVLLGSLDIAVLCDPSMGESDYADETGIVVTGTDDRHNIYILETVKKRLKPPELIDQLFRIWMKYRPRVIAIEKVNFSGIYRYWLEQKADEMRITLPLRDYNPGSKRSKEARIRGLAHFFSAGQVYIHANMHDFRDEYEQFPMGDSFHLLDAFAQGPEFWQKGNTWDDVDKYREKEQAFLDQRSSLTGY